MRVTLLGTGTSRGVPVIGCECKVCLSDNPKNKRLRSSILIEGGASVVIDTSVDFRAQMLRHRIQRLDAIIFTHSHADHILGLDDLAPFYFWTKSSIPVYASPDTLEQVRVTFRHLFDEQPYPGVARVDLVPIKDESFQIGGLTFEPIEVMHGELPVLGFRIGKFAYVTDVSRIPQPSMEKLSGIDYLVLDGLRYRSHRTHFSLSEAAEMAESLGARQTYLIHISHEVDHDEGNAFLPERVSLAYDGQVLEID